MVRLIVIAALLATGCASPTEPSKPPTPLTLPLASAAWATMHYLFTPSPLATVRGTLVVALQVSAAPPVVFESLEPQSASCSLPSAVRPFFWANDNGNGAYDRWWSNPRASALANGTATITVPLLAEHWSSVNGRFGNADSATRFQFDKALLNVSRLGVTFGGGCSFGHGIRVRGGAARFALTEYAVR